MIAETVQTRGANLHASRQWRRGELKLRRDVDCPVCGDNPTVRELIDYDQFCGIAPAQAAPPAAPSDFETTVLDLKRTIDSGTPPYILDVREPQEFQICRIPGSVLIPLGQVGARVQEIRDAAEGRPIVVHCKMGGRSAKAVQLLRQQGLERAQNLKGGILAWIDQVDPKLPKY